MLEIFKIAYFKYKIINLVIDWSILLMKIAEKSSVSIQLLGKLKIFKMGNHFQIVK
jgi:hypothetical protein